MLASDAFDDITSPTDRKQSTIDSLLSILSLSLYLSIWPGGRHVIKPSRNYNWGSKWIIPTTAPPRRSVALRCVQYTEREI